MAIKIEHKVSHDEWDEAHLTPEQFIEFDGLYHSKNDGDDGLDGRYDLYPTFVFDNGSVYTDESWGMDEYGRVSTSSYSSGIMSFSESRGQYIKSVCQRETELGHLVAIEFTVKDDMRDVFKKLTT